jgi:Fe-S cluster assembly iron-binding protein IscA
MLHLTSRAAEEIKTLVQDRGQPGQGIRVVIQGYG